MEQAENAVQSGDLIDEETFHQMFCMAFDITHGVTKLNSLNIPEQDDKFVACTRVIYKRILKMPMFHFMLRPGGELIGDLIVIGAFVVPVAKNVSNELAERQNSKTSKPAQSNEMPSMNLKEMAKEQTA